MFTVALRLFGFVGIILALVSTVHAKTLHVPADGFKSIQAAINQANDGDVIIVAPGTYIERIDFLGKAVTLASSDGPEVTILRGGGVLDGRAVVCVNGEGPDTVLRGFTITAGVSGLGGGMRNIGSSPRVTDCVFQGNVLRSSGGAGMRNTSGSSPTVSRCVFLNNSRGGGAGGGLFDGTSGEGSHSVIADCIFRGNTAGQGGGIHNSGGNQTITNCTFEGNLASIPGGGLLLSGSDATVTGCLFFGNGAFGTGGGMEIRAGNPVITNCAFIRNGAGVYGGGMSIWRESTPTISHCSFIGNRSDLWGGAIFIDESNPVFDNCTFAGNSAFNEGDGFYNRPNAFPRLISCILWPDDIGGPGAASLLYSIIQGGSPGNGNLDLDPRFVDAMGSDGIAGTGDEDVRLLPDSPAIGAGHPAVMPIPGVKDLDGHARVLCDRVDIGAYEFGVGDYDCNRRVDLADFRNWRSCVRGPEIDRSFRTDCLPFDFDGDDDIDLEDHAAFQRAHTAP